jgi:hypothetical protein
LYQLVDARLLKGPDRAALLKISTLNRHKATQTFTSRQDR